jgi:hypothetical protein
VAERSGEWLRAFVKAGGVGATVDALIEAIRTVRVAAMEREYVGLLRTFINATPTLEGVVAEMKKIMLLLDSRRCPTVLKAAVLELFSAVVLVSPTGHRQALDALGARRRRKGDKARFGVLVEMLQHIEPGRSAPSPSLAVRLDPVDRQLKINCIAFINALVTGPSDLDARCYLREEFVRADVQQAFDALKATGDRDLIEMCEAFEEAAKTDQQFLEDRIGKWDVRPNDPNSLMHAILRQFVEVNKSCLKPFIATLQSALCFSEDPEQLLLSWVLVERIVQQISIQKEAVGFEDGRRIELRDVLEQGPGVIERTLRIQIAELEKERNALRAHNEQMTRGITTARDRVEKHKELIRRLQSDLAVANALLE